MKLATLLLVPIFGIAVCLFVVVGLDQSHLNSLLLEMHDAKYWYDFCCLININTLQEAAVFGLYMVPSAYVGEFGLFLPIHQRLVRKNMQHVGAYALAGGLVGVVTGVASLLMFAVVVRLVKGYFALPPAQPLLLQMAAVSGASAGAVAALIFRAMWPTTLLQANSQVPRV